MSTNLPASRVPLFGRDAEIELLAGQIVAVHGRLVTITGVGGIGKTSLATEVARLVEHNFPDGAWLADLSAIKTPENVAQTIARAVGIREAEGGEPDQTLVSFLRDRRLLLFVDNCEHLVDTCAALMDQLLDGCAELRILATSREPLRVAGEVVYPLQPLKVPPLTPSEDSDIRSYAAVELFLDRAQAVRPDFALNERNTPDVCQICQRLDGIPLALELAGARVAGMTPDQIAQRLQDNFELLLGGGRSRPERHQTLRAAVEWSHELLSPEEQLVFRRLGTFSGSWSLPAAEAICGADGVEADEVSDLVALLVEKSLVTFDGSDIEPRYRLLGPVNEYAQGRLAASGESESFRDRHRKYFVAEAELAEPGLHQADQSAWLLRLDHDLDNIRAAIRTGHARSDHEGVLRLVGALWWYLWQRGLLREGLAWIGPSIDNKAVSKHARLAGLAAAAMLSGSVGRSDEALRFIGELKSLAGLVGDVAGLSRAASLLGIEAQRAGDLELALVHFQEALALALEANHSMLVGHSLVNVASALSLKSDSQQARSMYEQAVVQFEAVGDRWGLAYASTNLAGFLRRRGEDESAAKLSSRAVRLLSALGDRFYLRFAVEELARNSMDLGQPVLAAKLFGSAEALKLATGALLSPGYREEYERALADLRKTLGEPVFQQAWAEGLALPPGTLVEAVLSRESAVPGPEAASSPVDLLTRREQEVAALIAEELSNRQIADRLVITPGTAGVHVEHILRKLDLRSRHQVAAWARSNGLVSD